MDERLDIPDLTIKNFAPLVDDKRQYTIKGTRLSRHRIINKLPGTIDFCPLIKKTKKRENYISARLSERKHDYLRTVQSDVLQRASAFLLLRDSQASFTAEGEKPRGNRAIRWGKAIGRAGGNQLSKDELLRL